MVLHAGEENGDRFLKGQKALNCIIDETALIDGAKQSAEDGIKRLISTGLINLFIPLHTLDQLDKIRRENGRLSSDAREVVHWLDLVTSETSAQSTRIYLQGVNEAYNNWTEVEKILTRKSLSINEGQEQNEDKLEDEISSKLNINDSSDMNSIASSGSIGLRSKSPSSPRSLYSSTSISLPFSSPCKEERASSASKLRSQQVVSSHKVQKQCISLSLRPFFNYAVWRMRHKSGLENSLSYVVLTNDPKKSEAASYFGFRVMRVEQLRELLEMEQSDSDFMAENLQKENKATLDDMGEVVVLKRHPGDKLKRAPKIWDPNQFERQSQGVRGRGRGRQRGGSRGSAKGRGSSASSFAKQTISKPIDPDSFTRISPNARRGFGGRKKLWEPS